MHEMSLIEGILRQVEGAARREGARRVKTVVLEIGRLASVETDAMHFCFAAVEDKGLASGAQLEIIEIPGAGLCNDCGGTVPMDEAIGTCPLCGSCCLTPTAGTEMRVREIEIEEE
mgnify:CR=1 FL=1